MYAWVLSAESHRRWFSATGVSCHPAISDGISCRPGLEVKGVARQLVKRIIRAYVTRPGLMRRALLNHSWNRHETQAATRCCKTWVLFSSCRWISPSVSNHRENTESPLLEGPSTEFLPRHCHVISSLALDLKFKEVAFTKGRWCMEVPQVSTYSVKFSQYLLFNRFWNYFQNLLWFDWN